MEDFHATELAVAWRAFGKFRPVLCSRRTKFEVKLKLFDAVVTPAALYGSEGLTLTGDMARELRTVWRRMLRTMLAPARQPEETWVDYIQRSTRLIEAHAAQSGHCSWEILPKSRKWKFAGEISRSNVGKWSTRLLSWRPFFRCMPYRRAGRPVTRWTDDLEKLAGGNWRATAQDENAWMILAHGFSTGI